MLAEVGRVREPDDQTRQETRARVVPVDDPTQDVPYGNAARIFGLE